VQAIAHTHQPLAVVFGAVGRRILPMTAVTGTVAEREIPIFDSSRLIRTKEQGQAVARALGNHGACHLRHHGLITVGHSVEEAVVHTIWIEEQAKMTLLASLLGSPEGIRPEELAVQAAERDPNFAGRWAYYVGLLDES
jgi:ribulose-5-phosphate 4-epimerase/fuculose-1-phosphate aldolase